MLKIIASVALLVGIPVVLFSYRLPFSLFYRTFHDYDMLFNYAQKASDGRTQVAKDYFRNLNPLFSSMLYEDRLKLGNLTFVIALVTVKRGLPNAPDKFGYIAQSTALIDSVIKNYSFFNRSVPFICNVDLDPNIHQEAKALYKYFPYAERYGQSSLGLPPPLVPGSQFDFGYRKTFKSKYEKETHDYAFCLMSALALKPDHIIMLEDDVLPHSDFPSVLEHIINTRLKESHTERYKKGFAYLKLYFPLKWQGFALEIVRFLDLICYSLVIASFLHLCCYFFVPIFKSTFYSFRREMYKIFALNFFIAMLFLYLLGRQNVIELRRLSKHLYRLQTVNDCCTQAVLYPSYVVKSLCEHLVYASPTTHLDLAIMDFAASSGYVPLQIEPNLFYHTGIKSSLNMPQKHPEEFIFHL